MTQITLTPEQSAALETAGKMVAIRRHDGSLAGLMALTPKEPIFTEEEVAAAEQIAKSNGRWYTTEEVLQHLRTQERA